MPVTPAQFVMLSVIAMLFVMLARVYVVPPVVDRFRREREAASPHDGEPERRAVRDVPPMPALWECPQTDRTSA